MVRSTVRNMNVFDEVLVLATTTTTTTMTTTAAAATARRRRRALSPGTVLLYYYYIRPDHLLRLYINFVFIIILFFYFTRPVHRVFARFLFSSIRPLRSLSYTGARAHKTHLPNIVVIYYYYYV